MPTDIRRLIEMDFRASVANDGEGLGFFKGEKFGMYCGRHSIYSDRDKK